MSARPTITDAREDPSDSRGVEQRDSYLGGGVTPYQFWLELRLAEGHTAKSQTEHSVI